MQNSVPAARLILVGGNGYLGRKFAHALPEARVTSSREGKAQKYLDLTVPESWQGLELSPQSVVVLLAAESAPDACAKNPERARAINVHGSLQFIQYATSQGARVVGFSSDVVLGESVQEADEAAPSHPVGIYGVQKAELEAGTLNNPLVRLARLSYVCSPDDKFAQYLGTCARSGQEAEIFDPFARRAVAAGDVVDGVLALCRRWNEFPQPVLNFAGPELLSRSELAAAWMSGTNSSLQIKRVEPPLGFFNSRPRVINMVSCHFDRLLSRAPMPASQAFSGA